MRHWTAAVLGLALAAPAADGEAEIRELVLEFNRAYQNNDLEAYFGCYAADATVQWWPDGRRPVAAYRAEWEALIGSGARVVRNAVSELVVRMAPGGEAAHASYRVDFAMRSIDGALTEEQALETDVVHRVDGRWRIVHVHYQTRAQPASAPD